MFEVPRSTVECEDFLLGISKWVHMNFVQILVPYAEDEMAESVIENMCNMEELLLTIITALGKQKSAYWDGVLIPLINAGVRLSVQRPRRSV